MRKVLQILVNTVLPVALLVIGVVGAKTLISNQPEPPKKPPRSKGVLVEVKPAERVTRTLHVTGHGATVPARRIAIQPQVSGRVDEVHPALITGGRVASGEVLVEIEDRDYRIAQDQAEGSLDQAQAQLAIEESRQDVAQQEWELFKKSGKANPKNKDIATRVPYIQSSEANVDVARSRLKKARLDRSRTRVEAPFDLLILNENVEIGQIVGPQSVIAQAVGTDAFHVQVSIPISELPYIRVPGVNAASGGGSEVTVHQETTGEFTITDTGRIERLLGELDPAGRMARVVISIPKPLDTSDGQLPLLLGAYVRVLIPIREPIEAVAVGSASLHEGNLVYVMTDEGTLDVRDVEVVWREDETVYIGEGLEGGESIVTSRLGTPTPGMRLRTEDEAASDASEEEAEQ